MFLLLLSNLLTFQQAPLTSAETFIQQVRSTMNYTLDKVPASGLLLRGKGVSSGVPSKFTIRFNRSGHFLEQVDSLLGSTTGYDGKDVWTKNYSGESFLHELGSKGQSLFIGQLYTGMWLDKNSGMSYTLPKEPASGTEVVTLNFTHATAQVNGSMRFDRKTLLPLDCSFTSINGQHVTVLWKETIEYQGMKLPRHVVLSVRDDKDVYEWESIVAAPEEKANPYTPRITLPHDFSFDSSKLAMLEVKKALTGHLLVKPLVNGKDVGWFILDSGAGVNVLSTRVTKELGLETFGEVGAVGVGGVVKSNWSRPKSISLGRLTIQNPVVVNIDLAFVDAPMGTPIAGIIGHGTFHRSVLEIDFETAKVSLFDPKTYEEQQGKKNWSRLYVSGGISHVDAEFEGHKGIFKLDTGAAGSTVAIHSPAVKKLKLLENRKLGDTQTGGVGGMQKAKSGKLKYFEIGGHRHDNIEALFSIAETGAFNDGEALGNIGGDLVKPFRMVFDYQNRRIAFVKVR